MSTQIKLTIASDGERCGECIFRVYVHMRQLHECVLYDYTLERDSEDGMDRCQACLDAEVRDD